VTDPFSTIDSSADPAKQYGVLQGRLERRYYRETLDWFFGLILEHARPESFLEIGCGTGGLLEMFRGLVGGNVDAAVGVDYSMYVLRKTRGAIEGVELLPADGRALPFADGSLGAAFAATVLVHARDPQRIVDEMARVVRPGGLVALLDQDFETAVLYPGDKDLTRRVLNAASDFWSTGCIGRRLPDMLRRSGLRVADVKSRVRIDREFDQGFFGRIRDWIVEGGFDREEADRWLEELKRLAPEVEFMFSRNFYTAIAIK